MLRAHSPSRRFLVAASLCTLILASESPASDIAEEPEADAKAEAFLHTLPGTWCFELFPHRKTEPTRTGKRVFERVIDGHPLLTWTEVFDGLDILIAGVLGYDPAGDRFFEIGSPTSGPVDYWLGEFDKAGDNILWIDPSDTDSPDRGRFALVSSHVFEFHNKSFRVVFRRKESCDTGP